MAATAPTELAPVAATPELAVAPVVPVAPAVAPAIAAPAPLVRKAAPALAVLLGDGEASTWRDNLRCGLITAGFLLVATLTCGVAGSFTTLSGGAVTSTYSTIGQTSYVTTTLNTSTLFFCESVSTCTSADAVFCAAANVAVPNGCFSTANSSPVPGWSPLNVFFGSAQLRAGLAFAVIAWLFDVLALLLFALAIVEIAQVPAVLSRGGLATWGRLPGVMAVVAASTVARIIALGCAVNFGFVAFGNAGIASSFSAFFAPVGYVATGASWSGAWVMTGSILLFVALALQVVAFVSLWITVKFAKMLDTTAKSAEPPRVSAVASVV